jgi:hypothetical protein
MSATLLLGVTGVLELLTGLALLFAPSLTVQLLVGEAPGSASAIVVGRVAGSALLAIGLICGLESRDQGAHSRTGLRAGLLAYNVAVPMLLAHAALANGARGALFWPAVVGHATLALWCLARLR